MEAVPAEHHLRSLQKLLPRAPAAAGAGRPQGRRSRLGLRHRMMLRHRSRRRNRERTRTTRPSSRSIAARTAGSSAALAASGVPSRGSHVWPQAQQRRSRGPREIAGLHPPRSAGGTRGCGFPGVGWRTVPGTLRVAGPRRQRGSVDPDEVGHRSAVPIRGVGTGAAPRANLEQCSANNTARPATSPHLPRPPIRSDGTRHDLVTVIAPTCHSERCAPPCQVRQRKRTA